MRSWPGRCRRPNFSSMARKVPVSTSAPVANLDHVRGASSPHEPTLPGGSENSIVSTTAKLCLVLAGALVAAGCGSSGGTRTTDSQSAGPPQRGGELTVLLDGAFSGSWPSGLDPATNTTGGANLTQMSAIYGGLFRLVADADGKNAKVVPHQADSFEYADGGRTVRIKLKPGITFTDGTAMDAAAVVFNIKRDMASTC